MASGLSKICTAFGSCWAKNAERPSRRDRPGEGRRLTSWRLSPCKPGDTVCASFCAAGAVTDHRFVLLTSPPGCANLVASVAETGMSPLAVLSSTARRRGIAVAGISLPPTYVTVTSVRLSAIRDAPQAARRVIVVKLGMIHDPLVGRDSGLVGGYYLRYARQHALYLRRIERT